MAYVLPGEVLASEEEYMNNANTFVDEEGNIRSAKIGKVNVNNSRKSIAVYGKDRKMRVGDMVEGEVISVRDKMILVSAKKVFDRNGNRKNNYIGMCAIFVRDLSKGYVENTRDTMKIGDIVRAELSSIKPGVFDLHTKGFKYGVIKSFCSRCRHHLEILKPDFKNRDLKEMICPNCKNREKRKTSKDYI